MHGKIFSILIFLEQSSGLSFFNYSNSQGDSGSSLMLPDSSRHNRWTIYGVVSFGNKCGQPGL